MDLVRISSVDGDTAVFYNCVLIAYYSAATDEPGVQALVNAAADGLSVATGKSIKCVKFEKNESFVHWESSKQVQDILWPKHDIDLLADTDHSSVDHVIDLVIQSVDDSDNISSRL